MTRSARIAAACFATVPVAILGASLLVTFAIAHGAPSGLRTVFRLLCHGIATRCIVLWGVPMPICARCTAIYVGLLAGVALLAPLLPLLTERASKLILFIAIIPLAIDGLTQATGLRESTNALRGVTGFLAGAAFGWWAVTSIERSARALADSHTTPESNSNHAENTAS
ncbi:MAG TPA: DUF2085 domain-containing protein [Thermoanaerobaculia bacterium]|nr:DUF2085 domain-containing protein [Thermoanaerobaculia bacterium]